MAKSPKRHLGKQAEIKDEPGAEQRFSNILKRALNTPPARKRAQKPKRKEHKKDG